MRALLLHNPTAGGGDHPSNEALLQAITRGGFTPIYCTSKTEEYKAKLNEKTDIVIVAGGDGTIAKVVRNLPDRSIPIAILPLGTSNNIALSLGISGDPERLAESLGRAAVQPLDVGVAGCKQGLRQFVEAVGLGALAKALDRNGPKPPPAERTRRGREAVRAAVETAEPERFKILIDGKKLTGEFLFVEVLNLCMTGPKLRLGSGTHPNDQLLDIVFLPAEKREEMLEWLGEEPGYRPAPLELMRGNRIEISSDCQPLRIDDRIYSGAKYRSKESALNISLDHTSMLVCIPPKIAPEPIMREVDKG